jgi:plasmid stabilization system protein ParE
MMWTRAGRRASARSAPSMAARHLIPVFTENLSRTLESIRIFLGPEGPGAYERLLDRLLDDIIPTICRFPESGRSLLDQPTGSIETEHRAKQLHTRLGPGETLREFIVDDYLLLYLRRGERIFLLAIKHHRQLSFDLRQFWG